MSGTTERSLGKANGSAPNAVPPGFADPILDSQSVFRDIMDAMARPGTIADVGRNLPALDSIDAAALCFLMALCDHETAIWLDNDRDRAALVRYLRFHTGARPARLPQEAQFALVADPTRLPPLVAFSVGDQEYPERSTTILLQVRDLRSGPSVRIEGPGIRGKALINVAGLDRRFWSAFAANRGLYPCGVDVVLTSGTSLLALPRSVIVEH